VRLQYFIVYFLTFALGACAPAAIDDSSGDRVTTAGGLACFTVTAPAVTDTVDPSASSCDQLCADRGAVCISAGLSGGLITPPLTCDGAVLPSSATACRCCAVAR